MKPSFALSLSFEGIGLLHRSFPGWNRVGEVALDTPDLPGALAVLRETAEQINGGVTSKLVIPNDQIKYLTLDLGVMSEAERRDVIRAALDGATPYPVDDLVYDWSVDGRQTQIAAVARDTLREAEDFASAHGFAPVSFVAAPPAGTFSGEPFFGPTDHAASLLAPGEEVQRDMAPIRVTGVVRLPDPEDSFEDPSANGPDTDTTRVTDETAGGVPNAPAVEAPTAPDAAAPQIADTGPGGADTADTDAESRPPAPAEQQATPDAPTAAELTPAPTVAPTVAPTAPSDDTRDDTPAHTPDHGPDDTGPDTALAADLATDAGQAMAAPPAPTFSHHHAEDEAEERAEEGSDPAPREASETGTAPGADDDGTPALSFSTIRAERDDDAVSAPALGGVTRTPPPSTAPTPIAPDLTAPSIPIDDDYDDGQGTAEAARDGTPLPADPEPAIEPPVALPPLRQGVNVPQGDEDAFDDLPPMPGPAIIAAQSPAEATPLTDADPDTSWHADRRDDALYADDLAPPPPLTGQRFDAGFDTGSDSASDTGADTPIAPPAKAPARAGRLAAATSGAVTSALTAVRTGVAARQARRAEDRARAQAESEAEAETQAQVAARQAEEQRMTVFGARKPAEEAPRVGGKPRYLGLILTLVLLVFLAGVAAWASIFGDEGVSRLFDRQPQLAETGSEGTDDQAIAELAAEGDEAETPMPPDGSVETALLDTAPDTPQPELRPRPARPHALTEEEAQARYAVTGVWQRAPNGPLLPDQEGADDLYTASIDPSVDAQDAVALPGLTALNTDVLPGRIAPPVPAGSSFDFDERGLVRATPEGTLNPEGVMVYAGKPPRVPATEPARIAAAAPPGTTPGTADTPARDPEQARLAGIRPKPRPEGLIEESERQNLGGLTRNELAAKRPKARPETLQAQQQQQAIAEAVAAAQDTPSPEPEAQAQAEPEAEADPFATATALAIGESRAPRARPGNFTRIVKRTLDRQDDEPAEATRVAAAVPRNQAVAPAAPSNTSVAKAATVRNQLNLRRINLIGTYGKPSSRSALVRLANGRYKKVKVGDRLDGGRVQAIGETELRYSKSGRNVTLKLPRG